MLPMRKRPHQNYLWINSQRQQRTGGMFIEVGRAAEALNLVGGVAIGLPDGSGRPVVVVEGKVVKNRIELAGLVATALFDILSDDV